MRASAPASVIIEGYCLQLEVVVSHHNFSVLRNLSCTSLSLKVQALTFVITSLTGNSYQTSRLQSPKCDQKVCFAGEFVSQADQSQSITIEAK